MKIKFERLSKSHGLAVRVNGALRFAVAVGKFQKLAWASNDSATAGGFGFIHFVYLAG